MTGLLLTMWLIGALLIVVAIGILLWADQQMANDHRRFGR